MHRLFLKSLRLLLEQSHYVVWIHPYYFFHSMQFVAVQSHVLALGRPRYPVDVDDPKAVLYMSKALRSSLKSPYGKTSLERPLVKLSAGRLTQNSLAGLIPRERDWNK